MDNPPSESTSKNSHKAQYFIGLGIGVIPLILFMISLGFSIGAVILFSLLLYICTLFVAIICMCIKGVRFTGYGILTMFFVNGVVGFIACTVTLSQTKI